MFYFTIAGNSAWASSGVNAVLPDVIDDSVELYRNDTLKVRVRRWRPSMQCIDSVCAVICLVVWRCLSRAACHRAP